MRGDDSGANEMVGTDSIRKVGMENLSATLLNLYCSMLCIAFIIAVLLVETRCFCDHVYEV